MKMTSDIDRPGFKEFKMPCENKIGARTEEKRPLEASGIFGQSIR